jgi:hypothetical protein
MSVQGKIGLSALFGAVVLVACAATPEQKTAREEAQSRLDAEIKANRGDAVSQICPRGSDGWKTLGDKTILLEARGGWYMAELAGACDPDGAVAGIATRSTSGSSCLSRGDRIATGRPRSGERCVITALYKWNAEAESAPSKSATPE